MRLGTRWAVGAQAPASLPSPVLESVAAVERELVVDGVDGSTWRWTLTWLEGKPVVELDDGTRILYSAHDGTARIVAADSDGDEG